MIRNLLPEDSRLAEIIASLSLILMSLSILCGNMHTDSFLQLFAIQRQEFWIVLLGVFGSLQLYSLINSKFDYLRCMMAFFTGCFLIWISIGSTLFDYELSDVTAFLLGIGNLYSFVINSILPKVSHD